MVGVRDQVSGVRDQEEGKMGDLISREAAISAMYLLQIEDEETYGCSIPEGFDGERAAEALRRLPSAEPGLIHCLDCRWWDRLEEDHPYGYCLACRSGTHTERWEISIYRQNRYDFYCADAEPKENEDDDE